MRIIKNFYVKPKSLRRGSSIIYDIMKYNKSAMNNSWDTVFEFKIIEKNDG